MPVASQIEKAEVREIRIPLEEPWGDAIQKFTALELPFVEITDAAGRRGTGFGYTIGTGGSAIVELIRAELLPFLVGKDARNVVALHAELGHRIHALTPGCLSSTAIAAIDVALWDLAGHRTQTPLHQLLGGAKDRVPIYNTHVGWLNRPLPEMLSLCEKAVKRDGFRALKLKVGKPTGAEDAERVAKVRERVGAEVRLMVDANQSWTIDEALPRIKLLEPYDLVWIEEPLLATDIAGFSRLGAHTSLARAGGESLYSPADFFNYLRQGAFDILQPDIARVGGITNALKVCHLAETANLRVAPHVSPELSLVVAAAVPNSMFIEFIPQMSPVLRQPIRMVDGCAIASESPGHGIPFDPEALASFEVRPRKESR